MTLVRRKRFRGYTDGRGYKTADAPANWPFGMKRPSSAQPRARLKSHRSRRIVDSKVPGFD